MLMTAQRNLAPYEGLLCELAGVFTAAGHTLYLVGGSLRDALLGRGVHDLDFTTDARPEQIAALLEPVAETVWDIGIEFGTISGIVHGQTVEITTFRADTYDGKSRNPQVSFGDTLEGDLIRRDFAANALALALDKDGRHEFRDPLNGLDQLVAGVLDTPDDPAISFHDDPLRMLRACRFSSQLGMSIAPRVRTAMCEMAGEIRRITTERVKQELDKLILGDDPARGFDLMVETGLADILIPEIPAMQMTQDEHMQHKDVYAHSLQVLRQAIDRETDGPDLVLRWAALLHDCGKPSTRAAKPGGGVTFYHHDVVGAKMARKRLRALKFSKQDIQDISGLIYLHQRFHGYAESAWNDSAVRRYVTDAGPLLERLHKLVRADCTTRNQRKAARLQRLYDDLEQRIADLKAQEDLDKVRPDLNGNEIMEILDIPAGPMVGKAWKYLKELRLDNGPMEREDAILALKQWWVDHEG
ncbi:MAG: CCA tRNA nucleotidyltransferase [Bifidobacterium sp.]|nr:CCA tRNA nucleotidyltransferase [Bifidobacterium sp.]